MASKFAVVFNELVIHPHGILNTKGAHVDVYRTAENRIPAYNGVEPFVYYPEG